MEQRREDDRLGRMNRCLLSPYINTHSSTVQSPTRATYLFRLSFLLLCAALAFFFRTTSLVRVLPLTD